MCVPSQDAQVQGVGRCHNGAMERPERPAPIEIPPARFRLLPFVAGGTAVWLLALLVLLLGDFGTTARDVALAGIALGLPLAWWAHRMDGRLTRR